MLKTIAIILAGGRGSRIGDALPKQFFKVAGKTILEHSIGAFERSECIDEIAVVVAPAYVSHVESMVLSNDYHKVKKILHGGSERHESTLAAIRAYDDGSNYRMLFHDAVRPLVTQRIISDVAAALSRYNAVDTAIAAADTIIEVDDSGNFISGIPNRCMLRRGQTPQGFLHSTIKEAYRMALQDADFMATDDCGVVNKYLPQEPIYVVRGEESNMKLTYKEDIFVIDKLFQLQSTALHENIDMSMLQDMVIVIFGGTSGIGAEVTRVAQEYGAHVFSFSRSMGVDISNRNDVKNALKKVFENTGRINFVVNSAAILVKEPLAAMQHDVIEKMIASNYCGMVNVAAESYEYLRASQGQLLLYTSSSYTRGRAFYSIYSSTKAAVVNFAQALAQEWECHKIRVNAINPERTNTPMRSKNFGSEPADTLLSAAEVAHASLKTLLSCFTGQVVDVKLKRQ